MSYPELYSDERVILQAQNVKVKSVLFEIVLTTRRLVLIDTKKNSIPPQEINLATLKDVESGENAIRDPTLTISIITISGNTRQMVLTFSKTSGGERRRECDEWVRALRQNITSTVYHPVPQAPVPKVQEPAKEPQPPVVQTPPEQPPAPAPHRAETPATPPPKKRIEIARPMKKITEVPPTMPVPVETSSLPSGIFCNRCGNRVPPESAFCNRCGTPVVRDTDPANVPLIEFDAPAAPQVPQVQVAPSPIFPTITDKKDRPIETVIHSIEPLIEGSVPRTAPAPLVPAKSAHYVPAAETPEPEISAPAPAEETPAASAPQAGDVQWPVLSKTGITDTAVPPAAPVSPPLSRPMPPATPPPRKIPVKLIGIAAVIIIAVIAGVFLFMQQGPAGTPAVTPTPAITTVATTATAIQKTPSPTIGITMVPTITQNAATPSDVQVPSSGVWVKVTYSGKYSGSVGTPGRMREITEAGGPFYQISTTDGPVAVSLQKSDGSSAPITVDVYKDGVLMKHGSTIAPKGMVEFDVSLKTATTPPKTTEPVTTTAEP